ncbi:MAG TPA: pilus assembly protein PilP [Myxococcaceae bacterium]|jgi:type IV pilus assembly protein PilP|nr:pilus assembly protein PilP [Myxococcaceae bacterium]
MSTPRTHLWMLACAAVAFLAACGSTSAPPPASPAKAPPPKPAQAAAPAAPQAPAYVYNPIGKRDPFRSPDAEPATQAALASTACTEPLCRFDIDQLTLVAVVSGDANPLAMVQDPAGRGYFVRRNTRVGRQGGKVTQILSDAVVITEYFTTPDGKTTANPITLAIKTEKVPEQETDLATGKAY